MGMSENWHKFIHITKSKSKSHAKASQFWERCHNIVSLTIIFLSAITTFFSLIKTVPFFVISAVAALATLISTVNAFMRPHEKKQQQMDASKDFKVLMLKMVRCETEREYEDLWRELNQIILDEPFIPKKYVTDNIDMDWSITPELQIVILEKENELKEAHEGDSESDLTKASGKNMDIHFHQDNGEEKASKELIELMPRECKE